MLFRKSRRDAKTETNKLEHGRRRLAKVNCQRQQTTSRRPIAISRVRCVQGRAFIEKYSSKHHSGQVKALQQFSSEHCTPPVQVLVHTARTILLPTQLWDLTPSLIHALAQVELLRRKAVSVMKAILIWDTYYQNNPHGLELISEEDRSRLKRKADAKRSDELRLEYQNLLWALQEQVGSSFGAVYHF